MQQITVFFVWQSDHRRTYNGAWSAIEKAVAKLNETAVGTIYAADRDTRGESGAVPIDHVILEKIRRADVVIADLTPVAQVKNGAKHKSLPNPNVMFELGFAREVVGLKRIVMFRDAREDWYPPFDIQQLRMIEYETPAKFRDELIQILPEMVSQISPSGLTTPQSVDLVRLLWSDPQIQGNVSLKAEVALELELLSGGPDDTLERLAQVFRTTRPWSTPGWPLSTSTYATLRELLSIALRPNSPMDSKRQAWVRLEDLMSMIPLHEARLKLLTEARERGWLKAASPNPETLLDWLERALAVGCEPADMASLTNPPAIKAFMRKFEVENPETLLARSREQRR